jgi:hypothetical protein
MEAGHQEDECAILTVVATRKTIIYVLIAALRLRKGGLSPGWWTFLATEDLPPLTVIPVAGGLYALEIPKLRLPKSFTITKWDGNTSEDTTYNFSGHLSGMACAFGKLVDLHGWRWSDKEDWHWGESYTNQYSLQKVVLQTATGGRLAMESDRRVPVEDEKDDTLSPRQDLQHFLITCSDGGYVDDFKTALRRLLCWDAGIPVHPGCGGDLSENYSPVEFHIVGFDLHFDEPSGRYQLRLDVRAKNIWHALKLADKAWSDLKLKRRVRVEHVVVDPREMQIHAFALGAADVQAFLEWDRMPKGEPWPTTSLVRITRRLATAKDVEAVWNTDPTAADVLRAERAVRIIQRAARHHLYNPDRGVAVKRAKRRFEEMREEGAHV